MICSEIIENVSILVCLCAGKPCQRSQSPFFSRFSCALLLGKCSALQPNCVYQCIEPFSLKFDITLCRMSYNKFEISSVLEMILQRHREPGALLCWTGVFHPDNRMCIDKYTTSSHFCPRSHFQVQKLVVMYPSFVSK